MTAVSYGNVHNQLGTRREMSEILRIVMRAPVILLCGENLECNPLFDPKLLRRLQTTHTIAAL